MLYVWERRENMCKVLVGKPEGTRLLGRQGRKWEVDIRRRLREIDWGSGFNRLRIGTGG
jgi:hypothetical protein